MPNTTASLIYQSVPAGEKAWQWINPHPVGEARDNIKLTSYDWDIQDIRGREAEYDLDSAGFAAVERAATLSYDDWSNEEKVKGAYYAEVEELLKERLGAHKVTIFDHTIRRGSPPGIEVEDTPATRQPVSRVHVDQTPESARNRVKRHETAKEAEKLLQGRVRLINVWRPFRQVKDIPLAVADFRSINLSTDLQPSDLIYSREQVGETFLVKHNPQHKWFYLADMKPEEVLLLKCFDSASPTTAPVDGIASLTPHTAFVDPKYQNQPNVKPRESIEIRALVYSD